MRGLANMVCLQEAHNYHANQIGFDTVGLGLSNATGPSLSHQIVAEVVTDSWWFGMLGLGFQPTNFTGYGNPQASFSDTLYSNKTISSMSWSYTAGASYRLKSVFGSLIFGGYDASKFTPNPIRFTMAPDNLRDLVVTVRSVTSTTSSGNTTILSDPIFAYIDSAVPEFYLPASACQAFEKAFNLTLDTASGLYLIDTATNNRLTALNPSVVFTLANQKTGGATTDITLPYSAFALNASTPFLQNHPSSLYFPLKQAPDENNYVLGRAFLQEAHVSTHYNSRTFNVSQAVFSDSATPSIVALPAVLASSATSSTTPSSSTDPRNHSKKKKGLGGGAIAGIVIGALAALALIALLAFLLLRRRKRSSATSTAASSPHRKPSGPVHEIDTGKRVDPGTTSAYTAQASAMTSEVSGKDSHVEKWGVPIMHPQELEADVPVAAAGRNEERHKSLSPVRENGRTPMAELGIEERGLGVAQHSEPRTAGYEQQREDDDIVSPNTDRSGSGRVSRRFGGSGSDRTSGRQSPVSEGTWTPTTPVVRKGSRFEERWNE